MWCCLVRRPAAGSGGRCSRSRADRHRCYMWCSAAGSRLASPRTASLASYRSAALPGRPCARGAGRSRFSPLDSAIDAERCSFALDCSHSCFGFFLGFEDHRTGAPALRRQVLDFVPGVARAAAFLDDVHFVLSVEGGEARPRQFNGSRAIPIISPEWLHSMNFSPSQ